MTDQTIAEIVQFRLSSGTSHDAFVQAAHDMEPLLKDAGGMIRRVLTRDDTGLWTDFILWSNMDFAKTAAANLPHSPVAAPFMQAIDPASVIMSHSYVHMIQET